MNFEMGKPLVVARYIQSTVSKRVRYFRNSEHPVGAMS